MKIPPANPYEEAEAEIRAALARVPIHDRRSLLTALMIPHDERARAIAQIYQFGGEAMALAERLMDVEDDRFMARMVADVLKEDLRHG